MLKFTAKAKKSRYKSSYHGVLFKKGTKAVIPLRSNEKTSQDKWCMCNVTQYKARYIIEGFVE
ncbi:hypothetical protein [Dickeya lacustris]|uniref:Uncharacterized protein n=1 Tax=Dickeya lacustris TaxID=2259638 RepID=A0ABY8G9Z6_9GAMM|nr:hypothetical protein [Dickeya lacustris]WFN56806.1 hypothetical protein O1Q98_05980 [Dickeya lacustris]